MEKSKEQMKKLFRTITKFSKVSDHKIIIQKSTNSMGANTPGGMEMIPATATWKDMDLKRMTESFYCNQTGGTLRQEAQQGANHSDTAVRDSICQTFRDRHTVLSMGLGSANGHMGKDNIWPLPHISHKEKIWYVRFEYCCLMSHTSTRSEVHAKGKICLRSGKGTYLQINLVIQKELIT